MGDPVTATAILEAGKFAVPGGLPQIVDSARRSGRRWRTLREPKLRVPICLAIRSENAHDAGLIKSLTTKTSQYISQQHLGATIEVQSVSTDDLENAVALLKVAHKECERLRIPNLASMPRDFQRLHTQRRARVYFFGQLVRRTSPKDDLYVLELQGILELRTYITIMLRPKLGRIRSRRTRVDSVFSSAQVNFIKIPVTDEESGMSQWSYALVRLVQIVIATCTQVQDDPIAAMDLLNQLIDQLVVNSTADEEQRKRFLKLLIVKSSAATQDALSRGDREAVRYINNIVAQKCPDDHDALVSMAYAAYYLEPRHPLRALEYAKKAAKCVPGSGDGTWQYDLAFLLAQNGYFAKSLQQYDRIAATSYKGEDSTVASAILFFLNELRRLPVSVHMFFIIGFLEWKKLSPHDHSVPSGSDFVYWRREARGDVASCKHARKMFKHFIRVARSPDLAPWANRAKEYIHEINKHLRTMDNS